jgi:hypothetical protein
MVVWSEVGSSTSKVYGGKAALSVRDANPGTMMKRGQGDSGEPGCAMCILDIIISAQRHYYNIGEA